MEIFGDFLIFAKLHQKIRKKKLKNAKTNQTPTKTTRYANNQKYVPPPPTRYLYYFCFIP